MVRGVRLGQHGVVVHHRYYRRPPLRDPIAVGLSPLPLAVRPTTPTHRKPEGRVRRGKADPDAAPATGGRWSGARRRRRPAGEPLGVPYASEASSASDGASRDGTASTDGEAQESSDDETASTDGETRGSTDGEPSGVRSASETSSTSDGTSQGEAAHADSEPGQDTSVPARKKRATKNERRRRSKAAAAARQVLAGDREEDGLVSGEATGGVENEASTVPPSATPALVSLRDPSPVPASGREDACNTVEVDEEEGDSSDEEARGDALVREYFVSTVLVGATPSPVTSAPASAVAEERVFGGTLEGDDREEDPTGFKAWWHSMGGERRGY